MASCPPGSRGGDARVIDSSTVGDLGVAAEHPESTHRICVLLAGRRRGVLGGAGDHIWLTTHQAWHAERAADAAAEMRTDLARGLDSGDAAARFLHHGPNILAPAKQRSALAILARQFRSLIVGLLVAAGGVALVLGDVVEALAILVVILLNAAIGFATEWRAASALAALRRQAVNMARVLRDGGEHEILAQDLVPGDVILLAAGDRVPADGRVFADVRLQLDKSALTGESLPVRKSATAVVDAQASLGDRTTMVHMDTAATDGRGSAIVTATGAATEMGRISALIAGVAEHGTPLEAKLAQLSRLLLGVGLVLCAVIVLVGRLRGIELLYVVKVGISLAIAVGMQRMAGMHALVRRLSAVEAPRVYDGDVHGQDGHLDPQ